MKEGRGNLWAFFEKIRPVQKYFIDSQGTRFEATPHGLLYCLKGGSEKKHACPDCYFCQGCSESRCRLCRSRGNPASDAEPDTTFSV